MFYCNRGARNPIASGPLNPMGGTNDNSYQFIYNNNNNNDDKSPLRYYTSRRYAFILPDLLFVGAPWVWASSHSDVASQRGVWLRCVAAVDTSVCTSDAAQ
jgi:hypothetical protein